MDTSASKAVSTLFSVDVTVGDIPSPTLKACRYFDEVADGIIARWVLLQTELDRPERPNSWFKRNMYRLIKAYVDKGRDNIFVTMAKRSGRSLVGLNAISDNPFKLALFAMWDDNKSFTRHQQRVFGNQMLYAYRHGIAAENLVGFIRAAGSAETIANKLDTGAREPGFDLGASSTARIRKDQGNP